MKFVDLIQETYIALISNKVRTGLTMLGIIIGIGSVIVMISVGQGAQVSIENSIQSLGSNLIQVIPGFRSGPGSQVRESRGSSKTLTYDDALAIKNNIKDVKDVSVELSSRYQVTSRGSNTNTLIVGTISSYPLVRNVSVAEGLFISDQHVRSVSKVAVIGPTVRDDLFGENQSVIGETIRINGLQFKIIGITEKKGGTGFQNQDDMIYIPLSSMQKFFIGDSYVSNISVQATKEDIMSEVGISISELLNKRHKISDPSSPDFSIINQNDIVETASSITRTLTILLGAVAGISLIVGGIGIMNMMLTTVTERTREIGLRKAIGARKRDINLQFLFEAVILTIIGGLFGIIIGVSVSFSIDYFGLIQTEISLLAIVLSFFVSALIGIVFGYYPARHASNMSPIDALRYE